MRSTSTVGVLGVLALAVVIGGAVSQAACPLDHDAYETDRPCWSQADCVTEELCGKPDAGQLGPGRCAVPSDGPCGLLDAGIAGYFCFPAADGQAQSCYYEPEDTCVECFLDGGMARDCPDGLCVTWRGRYGCQ